MYPNPEKNTINGLLRCYVASKLHGIIAPSVMDIHPVSGKCNLDCKWCIGRLQRSEIESLPRYMNSENIVQLLSKVLDPRWKPNWPNEFHFAGADSEPLIEEDIVYEGTKYLLQRDRVVQLITNGLLLKSVKIRSIISRIEKLSISLDVSNDNDYDLYKMTNTGNKGYSTVLENLEAIIKQREKNKSDLKIFVTFVATPKTFNETNWLSTFRRLENLGVNFIFVRQDLCKTYGVVDNLENWINSIKNEFKTSKLDFHAPPIAFEEIGFSLCWAPRLWPTIATDGNLYPCAHTATTKYEPFANLFSEKSLIDIYNQVFNRPGPACMEIKDIKCLRQCPPMVGTFNDNVSIKKRFNMDDRFL